MITPINNECAIICTGNRKLNFVLPTQNMHSFINFSIVTCTFDGEVIHFHLHIHLQAQHVSDKMMGRSTTYSKYWQTGGVVVGLCRSNFCLYSLPFQSKYKLYIIFIYMFYILVNYIIISTWEAPVTLKVIYIRFTKKRLNTMCC